ncbi:NAD-glutamate dehydrogenase domain-containing protein [Rothia sp. ZJ1223]|uniref:NAD-glutamate dehydrogenase domain-containing protein n=1 Tax=Rothia sp. ZJ1223 TaxID=2811098 RepID=UPI00195D684D|nr:NAD-glutamate dehydrogenase domain-containing protein [Rothia sp. ZJ1223]MBM7051370.1 NAD-glutamate dehydrogenase [Rothia sp. ZJ1223]
MPSHNDEFTSLAETMSFAPEETNILRAYYRYLLQLGQHFEAEAVITALAENADITRDFIKFFTASFDPSTSCSIEERLAARAEAGEQLNRSIQALDAGTSREILSAYAEVVQATVRTNYYQNKETLAFKLRPTEISFAPLPRPLWEIWVFSEAVEGTHLRFGMVSRGGLRWSDRPDDFRTEVLGLVKAQRVKNSVIIPNGSKGGFFPKGLPDRDAEKELYAQMGVDAYKLFIGSLLDVTDNLVIDDGQESLVHPENVIALDGQDHYLVVAADKGTATFSDIANGISVDRGFWLGDAFASGGSIGFDHKEMGITARGAWEAVKRHFAAQGHDSQTEEFTMVGIGGMAGDVFGNGVLLSPAIRLVAAFDSRHIFLDPNPDAAATFAERERLFNLPRAYWSDYNTELISTGGGIFRRNTESIEITPEVRSALGLEDSVTALTPQELIRAIIAAPVDLLYTGGTGTYVRASNETDADVADHTNDDMRITAADLRVSVVSEGGNLGLTQLARIEAAQRGVLVNTDAVDNSAGVETSDHEVNLKILVDRLIAAGEIEDDERTALIEAQVEEVGLQVLESNINQNILLQAERLDGGELLAIAPEYIAYLVDNAHLERDVEFLPTDAEIERRASAGEKLTSPELAVLAAYTKLWLTQALVEEDFAEDESLADVLDRYFPSPVTAKYSPHFWSHPLRQAIISTKVANELIDFTGIASVYRLGKELSASASDIAGAYMTVRGEKNLAERFEEIRQLPAHTPLDGWSSKVQDVRDTIIEGIRTQLANK